MKNFNKGIAATMAVALTAVASIASIHRHPAELPPVATRGGEPAALLQKNVSRTPCKTRSESDASTVVLIDEDFSRMTAGSLEAPDTETIIDNEYSLDPKYTAEPGWWGRGLHQAGGAVALNSSGGVLCTPPKYMSGEMTISFRVRSLANKDKLGFFCNVVKGGREAPEVAADGGTFLVQKSKADADPDGWIPVEIQFKNTYGGDDCYVQINSYSNIAIDDLKVTAIQSFMPVPEFLGVDNFTNDGFTLHWRPVSNADHYLVSVFKNLTDGEEVSVYEGFDRLKIDPDTKKISDTGNEDYAGWEFHLGDTNNVYTRNSEISSAPYALALDNDDDYVVSPGTGGLIKSFSLRMRKIKCGNQTAKVHFSGWDGFKWEEFTLAYVYDGIHDDRFDIADLTRYVEGKYYYIKIFCENFDDTEVSIDDFEFVTTSPVEREYVFENKVVEENQLEVNGLDPESDYFWTVKSSNADGTLVSNESLEPFPAIGVAKPQVLPASDIERRGAYTANWEAVPKATSYEVNNYEVYTAPGPQKEFVILNEDFSKTGSSAKPETPDKLDNMQFSKLDEYTSRIEWYGCMNLLADGALGFYRYYGISGQLQTPELTLKNNSGNYHVKMKVMGYAEDVLYVRNKAGMTAYYIFPDGAFHEIEFDMTDGTEYDYLTFWSEYGDPVMIDYITITQDLKADDQVFTNVNVEQVEDISLRFRNLEKKQYTSFAYNLFAFYKRFGDLYVSERSDSQKVDLGSVGIEDVLSNGGTSITGGNGCVRVTLDCGTAIIVSDAAGRIVANASGHAGENIINLDKGIYIVKAGATAAKVIVK